MSKDKLKEAVDDMLSKIKLDNPTVVYHNRSNTVATITGIGVDDGIYYRIRLSSSGYDASEAKKEIRNELINLSVKEGYTQIIISKELGISQPSVSKYLNEIKYEILRYRKCKISDEDIAKKLNISMDTFNKFSKKYKIDKLR